MKKKNSKRENVNLFFSAFLMLAYIVCGYFFAQFADTVGGGNAKALVTAIIFVVFGLLVFYATRVGEGKAIKRFSLITLLLLDLPALYIILASIFTFKFDIFLIRVSLKYKTFPKTNLICSSC